MNFVILTISKVVLFYAFIRHSREMTRDSSTSPSSPSRSLDSSTSSLEQVAAISHEMNSELYCLISSLLRFLPVLQAHECPSVITRAGMRFEWIVIFVMMMFMNVKMR